uniref:GH16 domain-containing protein n=1 Tax=Panagrolaimus sp. PS1159 TaxID=55785 RepID=A0AC35F0B4_9BILA
MAFKYGILEARIKIPKNQKGLWPAFWTLGTNIDEVQWPACGEIDILESGSSASIGENMVDRRLGAALHWAGGDKNNDHNTDWDLSEYFRTFKLTWTESKISVSIDDVEYFKSENPDDSFKKPHCIILNLAIGGQYTGIQDPGQIDAPFPAQMQVEYVRLYQKEGDELIV